MVTSSVSGYAHYKIITIKRINKQINKLVRCVDKQFQIFTTRWRMGSCSPRNAHRCSCFIL